MVNTHVPVATGVNADGRREVLGVEVSSPRKRRQLTVRRDLVARVPTERGRSICWPATRTVSDHRRRRHSAPS